MNLHKKILVTGSSGFVGNYIMHTMAERHPTATIIAFSRSGKIRCPDKVYKYPNIEFHKGDCLENDTFKDLIQDVDGVIHSVGTMTDSDKYKSMNRDTVVNMALALQNTVPDGAKNKNFVMISKPPPFQPETLSAK